MSLACELEYLCHDAKAILHAIAMFSAGLKLQQVLGLPLDRLFHFLVAAALFLIAVRFMARWKAALLAAAAIFVKEAVDVPVKLILIRRAERLIVTADSLWDLAAGVLGVGAGFFLAIRLGERWQARRRAPCVRPLPALRVQELPLGVSRTALGLLLCTSAAVFVGLEVAGISAGRSYLMLTPHLFAVGAVAAAYAWFGPANTLLLLIPALPFANWVQAQVAPDKLHVGSTLILALLCCELLRRLRRGARTALTRADWAVAVYAAYACLIVVVNCFRLGWTRERAYCLVAPLTGLAVYFLAKDLLANRRLLRRAAVLFAAAFLLVTSIAVVEFIVEPLKLENVPGSVYGSATALSPYLSLVWPFLLAFALVRWGKFRWLCWPSVAVGAVAILLVFVRACWAAAACAFLLLVVLAAFRRDWALGLGSALAVGTMVGMLIWSVPYAQAGPYGPLKSRTLSEAASMMAPHSYRKARHRSADRANEILRASPLLGRTGELVNTLHHAHALTYGLAGTALALVAIVAILACGWSGALRSGDALVFAVVAGATASVVAVILQGLAWSALVGSSTQPLLWYILALVPAALRVAREPAAEASAEHQRG